jgi:hypothetical protein
VRRPAAAGALVAVLALLPGCELAGDPATAPPASQGGGTGSDEPALGSPAERWPRTLPALLAHAAPEAQGWQDAPVLADVTVWLDADGRWERARLSYVAGEAERMLTLRTRPDELRVERPRLAGLELPVLPGAAVEEIPALPAGALEPVALGAAAAGPLEECGAAGAVRAVLYATGAPASWDGQRWSRTPSWRATVVTEAGGVSVDPTSGRAFAPLVCVDPLLLEDPG